MISSYPLRQNDVGEAAGCSTTDGSKVSIRSQDWTISNRRIVYNQHNRSKDEFFACILTVLSPWEPHARSSSMRIQKHEATCLLRMRLRRLREFRVNTRDIWRTVCSQRLIALLLEGESLSLMMRRVRSLNMHLPATGRVNMLRHYVWCIAARMGFQIRQTSFAEGN